jgi:hypothetical protein
MTIKPLTLITMGQWNEKDFGITLMDV